MIYSNVNNTGTNSITDGATIGVVDRCIVGSCQEGVAVRSFIGVVGGTLLDTGVALCSVTRDRRNLGKVNAATITIVIVKSRITITRINSDELCLINSRLGRVAHSRSVIRDLVRSNRVAPRRTMGRPEGGIVAHTLNIRDRITISATRLILGRGRALLLYASNLAGFTSESTVLGAFGRGSVTLIPRGLVRLTGANNNNSGVATIAVAGWYREVSFVSGCMKGELSNECRVHRVINRKNVTHICGTFSGRRGHLITVGVLGRRFLSGRRFLHHFGGRSGTVTVLSRPGVMGMCSISFNSLVRCVIVRCVRNVALGRCVRGRKDLH